MNTLAQNKTMRGRRGSGKNKAAFTLVELLVTIALIGILASLFAPALKKAREKSQQIACLSTLKQIGGAFNLYANDHDDSFPIGWVAWPGGSWCYQLSSYVNIKWDASSVYPSGSPPIFYCPGAKPFPQRALYCSLGYGYNRYFYEPAQGHWCKRSSVSHPSECLLAADLELISPPDYLDGNNTSSVVIYRVGQPNSLHEWNLSLFAFRHSGGLNMLFVDGHLEWREKRPDGRPHGYYPHEGGPFYE
ncbi:MAG: prepilin-type N-terminal cleavage/methylation domain-containing protein [Verrucomicrobiae bacterium]|nr:prepilin-type N-terminal cleavage/methylation domain-containing protein [Verrucomicrobiae bacterium]